MIISLNEWVKFGAHKVIFRVIHKVLDLRSSIFIHAKCRAQINLENE